ncbi:hypothetical protein ACROYT_G029813 [Oculina patagonica]
MGDGYNPNEPNARKYCEVIQIGIEDDTAEVTLFYTPEREFQISNGYKVEDKEETNYGRQYRRLKLVTSKANVIEIKRYSNGEYNVDANGKLYYFEGRKVEV